MVHIHSLTTHTKGGTNKQRFDPLKLLSDSPEPTRARKTVSLSPLSATDSSLLSLEHQKLTTVVEEPSRFKNKTSCGSGMDRAKNRCRGNLSMSEEGISPSNSKEDQSDPRIRSHSLSKAASANPVRSRTHGGSLRKPTSASTSRLVPSPSSSSQKPSHLASSTSKLPKAGNSRSRM